MRGKVARCVCNMCGAQLNGIGDWVEHACLNAPGKHPEYAPQMRRRGWPAHAWEAHRDRADAKRNRKGREGPAKTFDQLLTEDDRAWMREIEKAF